MTKPRILGERIQFLRDGTRKAGERRRLMREILVFENPDAAPNEWRVEDIDPDGDGSVSAVIFSGFQAEERAKRYADRLRTNTD